MHCLISTIAGKLKQRIKVEPFNVFATLIFLLAIIHTFLSSKLLEIAHNWEKAHGEKIAAKKAPKDSVHHGAKALHFVGEVETVFGIWVIVLMLVIFTFHDWKTAVHYVTDSVNFTEAFFIIVIMTLASSRPILKLSESIMARIATKLGSTITAWWFTILTLGPLLGSFITEPATMTISALLLVKKFYALEPSRKLKYATIALLFVNTSIGGTLTHFAAPPVLMVAGPWDWGLLHMLINFGWKAVLGICLVNSAYYFIFRNEFKALEDKFQILSLEEKVLANYLDRQEMESEWDEAISQISRELRIKEQIEQKVDDAASLMKKRLMPMYIDRITARDVDHELAERLFERRFNEIKLFRLRRELPIVLSTTRRATFKDPDWDDRGDPVPIWVTLAHIAFMVWTILNAHYPALFVPGLLFYLAFAQVTSPYQNNIDLKSPLLVGFSIGGLLIHGGVQGWWIEPVLGSLAEIPLSLTAIILTAFNDNAAITYLSTLIPGLTDGMKYAVVSGAVTGGGLTVIANAPNPAGRSILKDNFDDGVSPSKLFLAALGPTAIVWLVFLVA
ncbi:putative Na+/H+ antiporter [Thermodesulfobacteriota bacterium]